MAGGIPLSAFDELEATWGAVRRVLRDELPDATFDQWIDPLRLEERRDGTLLVRAPEHARTWIEERYLPLIAAAARRALGGPVAVELVDGGVARGAGGEPVEGGGGRSADARPSGDDSRLNPKYTFEQFVIGDGNRLAHAAALAAAELPGQAYNPLFLHGRPGLGKTHLLHAIGNYVQLYGLGLRVRYVTSESFTTEFVGALRRRDTSGFKERFREVDVLLVDDVQFLAAKEATTEEFFHTFNALYEAGAQLVLTSDREPSEMRELEVRLAERFASGLVAELSAPDFQARMAILRKRARLDAVNDVSDETLAEVARHVTVSVRSLEGALIRVVAYASLRGESPSPELARQVLERLYAHSQAAPCSLERIQEATAEAFGLSRDDLLAADRRPKVAFARQVAMYLARELTDESLPAIGRRFGGRNHSTVLHACRKVERAVGSQGEARSAVDRLKARLGA